MHESHAQLVILYGRTVGPGGYLEEGWAIALLYDNIKIQQSTLTKGGTDRHMYVLISPQPPLSWMPTGDENHYISGLEEIRVLKLD